MGEEHVLPAVVDALFATTGVHHHSRSGFSEEPPGDSENERVERNFLKRQNLSITEYSIPGALKRYTNIARTMGYASERDSDDAAASALLIGLQELNDKLEIPSLRECVKADRNLFDKRVEKMAKDALASGSPDNNPVVPDLQKIVELYHKAW